MKLLFLGDSITQGVGASSPDKCYVSLVGQRLGCEVLNYGVSGTRIGRQTYIFGGTIWNYDFRLRAEIMETDADRVFVFGGTNDFGHGSLHLGTPGGREENTFCYELRLLIERLTEKYGSEKLTFMLPIHRYDEEPRTCKGRENSELGSPLSEYISAMRKIISEYGIDIIDLYENGIPKPKVNTGDEYTVDGVHPTDRGYEIIAGQVIEYLKTK